jgi:hypothetical protein
VSGLHGFPGSDYHGLDGTGRVGTGPKRVGSSTDFFQIFLPTSVLDPSVLTDHGSEPDGLF